MASLTQKVAGNTLVQTIGKIIVVGTSIVTVSILTRYLGREGFGEYTTAMTYLGFFGILTDLGLYLVVVREMALNRERGEKIWQNSIGIRLVPGLIIMLLAPLIAALFFPYSARLDWSIAIAAISFWLIGVNQIIASVFQANLKMWKLVVGEVLGRLSILIMTIIVVRMDMGVYEVMWANALGNVVLCGCSLLFARKEAKPWPRFDLKMWKEILIETMPLGVVALMNRIYFNIDTIFLSIFRSQAEVGVYGVPYKMLDILISFPSIFSGLVFPTFSRHFGRNQNDLKRVYQKAFDFLMIVAIPLLVGLVILAEKIVLWLAGPDFHDSINLLRILAVAVVFVFFSTLSNSLVIAAKMQKKLMYISLISVVINVCFNLWLIPKYGYFAAAWITVTTELIVLILSTLYVGKYIGIWPSLKNMYKVVLAGAAMGLILLILREYNMFLLFAIGGLSYVSILFLVGGIDKEVLNQMGVRWKR